MTQEKLTAWYGRINQAAREMVGLEPETVSPHDQEMLNPINKAKVQWLATLPECPTLDEYYSRFE